MVRYILGWALAVVAVIVAFRFIARRNARKYPDPDLTDRERELIAHGISWTTRGGN